MTDIVTVTDSSLVTATENEIYQAIVEKCLELDPQFNTDPSTFDGYMNAWHAENYRVILEALREAWNSKDPAKARDVQLNIIGSLTGKSREDGTPTQISGTVTGANGTAVLAGSVVAGDESWTIDTNTTIGVSGAASVTATCAITGAIEPEVGSVTSIKTTIGGWTGFTNTGVIQVGTDEQSNSSFRAARAKAVSRPGSNQTDNTVGELFAIDNVLRVAAYENPTGTADVSSENPYGLPANSETYLIQGGDSNAIAKAIYIKKNPGVYLNGAGAVEEVTVTSDVHPSNNKLIRFGRPTPVIMTTVVELTDPLGNLPTNIEELIQDAIISYGNGELFDNGVNGFDQTGFDIGESIPVRRLDTPINKVIGVYDGAYINNVTVNTQTGGLITIAFDEISSWSSDNISVTVV
jgi:hypothetical protein